MLFRDETRNNLCTEEQFVRDAFCGKDASLHAKMVVQGCIRGEEIIPAVKRAGQRCILWEGCIPVRKNGRSGMHPGGRNNPRGRKEQVRDASGEKK